MKNEINSPSYRIIKEAVVEHLNDWNEGKWIKQEDFASYIIDNYEGITVQPQTVGVYVSSILMRLNPIKTSDETFYTWEELKKELNYAVC